MLRKITKSVFAGYVLAVFILGSTASRLQAKAQGVYYEILVRSFYDSNNDGIGDFKGLTKKLDYLNDGDPNTTTDLGIEGIWLMPVLESPSYHGYDVSDYYKIEQDYGTEKDFDEFISEAHKRGIKVIMDLVLNHTSSDNQWFKDSHKNINNKRDWYVWKNEMPADWTKPWGGGESKDVWRHKDGAYYYAIFGDHMPDLNYNSEEVITEMKNIIEFWLNRGIDGFRLDAVRYLAEVSGGVEGQADTSQTHTVLKRLSGHARKINEDCILIGEVWADNKTASSYYGEGLELSNVFNFDLAGAIINGVRKNNFRDIEKEILKLNSLNVPEKFFCTFLANHDQNRVASELRGDIRRLKLAASILLSMKGMPFVYYGEEIGMTGRGRHERIRTPMQWDSTANSGFTKSKPWESMQGNFRIINVNASQNNKKSLLNYYKAFINIRNTNENIFTAKREIIRSDNRSIYAYQFRNENKGLIYIHNFSPLEIKNFNLYITDNNYKYEMLFPKKTRIKNPKSIIKIKNIEPYGTVVVKAHK